MDGYADAIFVSRVVLVTSLIRRVFKVMNFVKLFNVDVAPMSFLQLYWNEILVPTERHLP